ncbi:MAG TPA: ABC transporter ATP-binding protein [Anaerolineales bacterium]
MPTNPTHQALIHAVGLKKVYKRGSEEIVALWDTDLSIFPGEFNIIIGPSGSGKSTLLHLLGGIDRPTQGELFVNGVNLVAASEGALTRFRRDNIGFVFQFYNLLPSLNALDNVILPLLAKGMSWKASRARGAAMLDQVGLSHRQKHAPGQLSGGEQQRVAIARAMVVEPCVILADEPTGDLDSASANSIIALMLELKEHQGVTFIVATHNPLLVQVATHSYELVDGRLASNSRG